MTVIVWCVVFYSMRSEFLVLHCFAIPQELRALKDACHSQAQAWTERFSQDCARIALVQKASSEEFAAALSTVDGQR